MNYHGVIGGVFDGGDVLTMENTSSTMHYYRVYKVYEFVFFYLNKYNEE